MSPESPTAVDARCLEAVKALGQAMKQMSLYNSSHPAAQAALKSAQENLSAALSEAPQGEISFILDHDKLVANGRVVSSSAKDLAPGFVGFLLRHNVNTVCFKKGLEARELASFCELAGSRSDPALAKGAQAALASKDVTHMSLAEALYAKLSEEDILSNVEKKGLEETLKAVIGRAVSTPEAQRKVHSRVEQLVEEKVKKSVEDVAAPLRKEKTILQNEQERTQSVLQNAAEGVVVVDDQGRVLMMNPAAEEIWGTKLAEVAGKSISEKADEAHVVTLSSEITAPGDRPIEKKVAVIGDEDARRAIQASSAVVQNEAGKIVGIISAPTDLAKQRELQKLEREFVAHVTHELRAPLSSIKAALEILREELEDKIGAEETRMLDTARSNSDRLERLIAGILDFSKIESGQMTIYPKPVDPVLIGQEAADSMKPWAMKKGLTLTFETEASLPLVMADRQRTVQVLVNLISNAIKFTPDRGKISLKAARLRDKDGFFVMFSVSDTGPGIPPAEHQRIFEKFVQVASGEINVGGVGLGLAIAKALVHKQGGRLHLESRPGKGATFSFTLPLAPEGFRAPEAAPAEDAPWWKKLLGIE